MRCDFFQRYTEFVKAGLENAIFFIQIMAAGDFVTWFIQT